MNSKFRWLLHKTVEENFAGLFTFSVGEEFLEQVVVCRLPTILRKIESGECTLEKALLWAHRKHGCCSGGRQADVCNEGKSTRQSPKMKALQDKPQEGSQSAKRNPTTPMQNDNRKMSRRPDIQLYVPRARRNAPACAKSQPFIGTSADCAPDKTKANCTLTHDSRGTEPARAEVNKRKNETSEGLRREGGDSLFQNKALVDNSLCVDQLPSCAGGKLFANTSNENFLQCLEAEHSLANTSQSALDATVGDIPGDHGVHNTLAEDHNANCTSSQPESGCEQSGSSNICCEEEREERSIFTSDSEQKSPSGKDLNDGDGTCQKLSRTVQEKSSSEKCVPSVSSQSGFSEKKEMSFDRFPSASLQSTLPVQKGNTSCPAVAVQSEEKRLPSVECTEKDSWDSMFDENGDCLHPSVLEGLKSALGKVEIQKPKFDYLVFQPQEPDLSDECYDHVLELYDFPAEFKTQNLMMAFSSFKDRGFDIKWVDDTHALAIFSSPLVASEALELQNPFIKTRPVSQATSKSKFLVSKNLDYLLPSRPRPETSALRARRMITGALGMRSSVSKEERETERRKLQVAKENKRQVAKQKQDVWNGTVS